MVCRWYQRRVESKRTHARSWRVARWRHRHSDRRRRCSEPFISRRNNSPLCRQKAGLDSAGKRGFCSSVEVKCPSLTGYTVKLLAQVVFALSRLRHVSTKCTIRNWPHFDAESEIDTCGPSDSRTPEAVRDAGRSLTAKLATFDTGVTAPAEAKRRQVYTDLAIYSRQLLEFERA